MSAKSDYLAWRRGPPVGCMFARLMSARPGDFGQAVEELPGSGTPAQVADEIVRHIDRSIADQSVTAVALLLPSITTLEHLAKVVLALRGRPLWDVTTSMLEPPPTADMVVIRVVREIPFGQNTCPSEALVFGPFPEFPATRRSPVTAFELFVGEPLPQDPKTHGPTTKANFAHIDLLDRSLIKVDLDQKAIDTMMTKSMEGRKNSLGGVDDKRAKAKVTLVIPTSLARELGCAP